RKFHQSLFVCYYFLSPLPPSVEDVKALACWRVIIFAIELGLQEVVVEGILRS
ncbi:hypothetical protein SO802_021225, partial [Lithocarpus litseifolius]